MVIRYVTGVRLTTMAPPFGGAVWRVTKSR